LKIILNREAVDKGDIMKIAISATGRDLDARVDPRFGRCLCFVIVETESSGVEVLENEAAKITGGAGVQAAQMIANAGVDAVITGSLGPNAAEVLAAAGLKVYTGISGTLREVLQRDKNGTLQATFDSSASASATVAGTGPGVAVGRGRGMGRGRGGRGRRVGAGPTGNCVCPACGEHVSHQPGLPCFEVRCPKCGAAMIRP
jgi:predicted Fe-Mo cluster-binding NifX family protein